MREIPIIRKVVCHLNEAIAFGELILRFAQVNIGCAELMFAFGEVK